jgi:hypothetical protein
MSSPDPFDPVPAHRVFAGDCFNRAWDLLVKSDRTADEDELMAHLAHASVWHWLNHPECTARHLSIGYWQLSRVYAVLKRPAEARRHAETCLRHSQNELPFYLAYAHEALARSAGLNGDAEGKRTQLQSARDLLPAIADAADREALENDLMTI